MTQPLLKFPASLARAHPQDARENVVDALRLLLKPAPEAGNDADREPLALSIIE